MGLLDYLQAAVVHGLRFTLYAFWCERARSVQIPVHEKPYSVKFSRLKILAGLSMATKMFSCEIQVHNSYNTWLES